MELRERQGQLSALAQYAQEARSGRGRMVLVSGEAGVGKSALVEHFASSLEDARVLWGACDGQFTPRPLGPLLDIAEQVDGELARLVAEGAQREALFAAARDELARGTGALGPLTVAVVEDVHWADEATLDLLRFLGRRLREARCLLLVTYRDPSAPVNDPLVISLGDLSAQSSTRRIAVPPLTRAAVDDLAEGGPVSGEELYRLTAGNPFFVGEVLRGTPGEIPPSARDAVLARLAQLDDTGRRYAEAAALMGARIDPVLLGEVVGEDPDALDALVASGVLVSDETGLRFPHELARAAVEQETPRHRRTPLHRRVLDALVARSCPDDARLAYHAEGSGDAEAVLRFAPAAARRAAVLRSHREAALQLERALRFADGASGDVRARLEQGLALELSLVDRWEDATPHVEKALELWARVDDPAALSGAQLVMARVKWRMNEGRESLRLAELARRTVAHLGETPALARADADLAHALMQSARGPECLEMAREAQRLAAYLDLPDVLSDALNTEACQLASQEDPAWYAVMLRSMEVARDHGLQGQAGRAYANLHAVLNASRRYSEATHWYREGQRYCEDHDIATYGSCLRSSQAEVELGTGNWERAETWSRQVLNRPHLSPANTMMPRATIGRVLARRGDPGAMEYLDASVESGLQTEEPEWLLETVPCRVEAHWLSGDLEAARRDVETVAAAAGPLGSWRRGTVASWQRRLGMPTTYAADTLAEPDRLSLEGRHEEAARAWDRLLAPYEAAMCRFDAGTEASLRQALAGFEALGADAAARLCRRELRRLGVRSVPAGARASTREHPAGLTPRESEVLDLLAEGLRNDEIAARLVISVKTVDHHVSAVLGKLGVSSRGAAVTEARRLGTLTS